MKKTLYIFAFIFAVGIMLSCRSAKQSTEAESNKPIVMTTVEPKKPSDDELLIERVQTIQSDFKTLNCKLSVEYEGIIYTGSMRMKRNNAIWISMGKFGIEAVRLMITQDSIYFINKLNSSYFKGGYNFFTSIIGFKVNYSIIQSLLLGESITQSHSTKGVVKRNGAMATITFSDIEVENSARKLKADLTFNTNSNHIEKNFVQVLNTINKLQINYSSFIKVQTVFLPEVLDVTVTQRNITKAQVRLTKQRINEAVDMPFNIPQRYKEMR